MPAPTDYLERTRGRILAPAEHVRVVSRVDIVRSLPASTGHARGRVVLALTESRLLLVTSSIRATRAQVIAQWPAGRLYIKAAKRKVGNNLIHIQTSQGQDLWFEWISGHRPQQWANLRFRQ